MFPERGEKEIGRNGKDAFRNIPPDGFAVWEGGFKQRRRLLGFLFVLLLDGIDELLWSHGAIEQRLEARDNGAGLHARGRVVDVVGGIAGLHQSFVGGQHLTQQLVVGARGLAFAHRRIAVVHCDLAGLVGLEEVQECRRGVLVLGVGRNTECGETAFAAAEPESAFSPG